MNITSFTIKQIIFRYVLPGFSVLVMIWFIFSYALYKFPVTPSGDGDTAITYVSEGAKKNSSSLLGIYFVPRNTDYIEVAQASKETRISLQDKPVVGIKTLNIALKQQNTVTKIGKNSLGCNGIAANSAFSYKCFSDSSSVLLYADYISRMDNVLLDSISLDPTASSLYRDGLLTISSDVNDSNNDYYLATYTNIATRKTTEVPLTTIPSASTIRFVPDSTGGRGFSVIDVTRGVVYYFDDLTARPTQVKKKVSDAFKKKGVDCSLRHKTLTCYYGSTTELNTGSGVTKQQEKLRSNQGGSLGGVDIYDFARKNTTTFTSGYRPLQKICSSDDGRVYALSGDVVLVSSYGRGDGQSLEFTPIAHDARQLACGKEIIYSTGTSLYRLTQDASYLVFYEPRMRLSTLQSYGGNVLFNTYLDSPSSDEIAHTYNLNLDTMVTESRPERKLPYNTSGSDLFLEFDYRERVIYIKPAFSAISDKQTNQTVVDQNLLTTTKRQIEQQLEQDGLLQKYRVVYAF